ncbi:TusE/DsrC/DsvC family sulfur relay protein [Thiolapillus sp.]|uniref:TusE/DsrC/DsvC family sulfur relay protein n=1 Tax=Thiolapillus sp. TaxID=2017437 RepID=UPI003AF6D5CE
MVLMIDGRSLETTEQGFLCSLEDWDEEVAVQIALQQGIELTEAHWEIIHFQRDYYIRFRHLPNSRMFVKAIRNSLGAEKGSSRYLQRLFPEGPLKYACMIAGLPKPPTCL